MRTILSIITVFLLLTGCGSNNQKKPQSKEQKQIEEQIPVIDLSATYSQSPNESACELEYIPLETKNNVLIDKLRSVVFVSDERIVVSNFRLGEVFIFDGKGKILHRFNHKGGGPKEYPNIRKITYDFKNKEIFIFSSKFAIVYSENGDFKRRWNYGNIESFQDVFVFDDETLLAHTDNSENTDSIYVFISKQTGEILSTVNLPVENVIATSKTEKKNGVPTMTTMTAQQLYRDGAGFILAPISLDTVYLLTKDKQLKPIFAKTPPVHDSDPPTIIMPLFVSDQLILLMKFVMKLGEQPVTRLVHFDRKEKLFYKGLELKCSPCTSFIFVHTDFPQNLYAALLDVHYIKECIKNGDKIDPKLTTLAESLDDDDNPVLEIIKFK